MEKIPVPAGVLLRRDDKTVFFSSASMELFNVVTPGPLDALAQDLVGFGKRSAEDISDYQLDRRQAIIPIIFGSGIVTATGKSPSIGRLTLNISNACNLWCSYCYADHGYYHSDKSFLSQESTQTILGKIVSMYGDIKILHFFGGEPLLNLKAIDAACEFFAASSRSNSSASPSYVATTNGTISSQRVLDTLKRWEIDLTVSWDGPKELQDKGRPMVGKGSSYDKVRRSLERFQKEGIHHTVECTYNAAHLNAGVSIVDLMNFFFEHADQKIVHVAPASTPAPRGLNGTRQGIFRLSSEAERAAFLPIESLVPMYREAARYSVRNFLKQQGPVLEFADRVIQQLLNGKKSLTYCPAFFDQLSIATDGSAYPCFMFIGDSNFNLGNILTDDFPTRNGREVFRKYFNEFGLNSVGTDKWFKHLYGGCVAGDFISLGNFEKRFLEPVHEAIIEECLFGLATEGEEAIGRRLLGRDAFIN